MRTPRLLLAAAAGSVLAVPAFAADLTVVFQTTVGGKVATSTAYYTADDMRTTNAAGDTIIEYGTGRIVTIDHKRKEYSEITLAEMEAAAAKMSAKMQEQMAALPPAMRQMMGDSAGTVTVTKGGVRKVAGYDCQEYTLALGTSSTMQVCASTAVAPPTAKVDYRKYAAFAGMANNPMFGSFAKLAEELRKIQGFVLAQSSAMKMMGQNMQSSREATEVKVGPIAASTFDIAALAPGYKKVPHPLTRTR